ncbi:hypothetical protein, partial [Streptomyces scabiei]|uniref:hypothetical protein n=1 Tax=Streptomyces scabiei TaxID=1930 RepID=UPI0038F6E24D
MWKALNLGGALVLALLARAAFAQEMPVSDTRLHAAALENDVAGLRRLLAEAPVIDTRDKDGRT